LIMDIKNIEINVLKNIKKC